MQLLFSGVGVRGGWWGGGGGVEELGGGGVGGEGVGVCVWGGGGWWGGSLANQVEWQSVKMQITELGNSCCRTAHTLIFYHHARHYIDVIMTTIASQINSLTVVYSTVYSDADQRNIKAPCHWPLCGEFSGTGEFPAQRASCAENVSIWWRHRD